MSDIHIGTSGWHYNHWRGPFYPAKYPASQMLEFYFQSFDTVEINNSFYRLPKPETFACWRESTPRNFLFSVKASRFITHNKKLKDPQNALENFLPRAEVLGGKLGPILFQLPPSWRVNLERLEEFLSVLPKSNRYAFEFREPSWLSEDVYRILRSYNAAFCIYELARFHTPFVLTADWTYVRLHGPTEWKYAGSYSDEQIAQWSERLRDWSRDLKAAFVYFDNDQAAYAAHNALTLKRLVAEWHSPATRAA